MICRDNSWSFGLALELWQYQKIQGENFVIDAPKKRRKSLSPKLKTWPSKGHEQRHKSNRRQGCPCSERPLAKLQPAPFFVSHSAKLQLVLFWSLSEAAGNASTSTVLKAVDHFQLGVFPNACPGFVMSPKPKPEIILRQMRIVISFTGIALPPKIDVKKYFWLKVLWSN